MCTVKGYYDREWAWQVENIAQGWGDGFTLSLLQLCVHLSTAKAMVGRDQDCLLPVEEAGVLWDSVCFVSLLLQRRVFLSRYFLHVRAELKASAQLASRLGATGHLWSVRLLPKVVLAQLPPGPSLHPGNCWQGVLGTARVRPYVEGQQSSTGH